MGKIGPDGVFNFGFNKDGSKYVGPGCGPCKSNDGVINVGQYFGESGFKAFKAQQRKEGKLHVTPTPTPGTGAGKCKSNDGVAHNPTPTPGS